MNFGLPTKNYFCQKKRANKIPFCQRRIAGSKLNRDNPGLDDDSPKEEAGTFQRASHDVLAIRRIVKVWRNQPPSTASSNPFAGIRLIPLAESAAKPIKATTDAPFQLNGDKTISEEGDSTASLGKNDADKQTGKGAGVSEANGSDNKAKKMKLMNVDKRDITFACVNSASSEGKRGLTTFALKFKDGSIVDEFRGVEIIFQKAKIRKAG